MNREHQIVRVFRGQFQRGNPARFCRESLPEGDFRRILIKPNWVRHQEDDTFPIEALVTSPLLIEEVIESCLSKYPSAEEITIGDVPLQNCQFDLLLRQSGTDRLVNKYATLARPRVQFLDLRAERFRSSNGFYAKDAGGIYGDPKGYREVVLDADSFLEPISDAKEKFRVADYSPEETISSHGPGCHRYLICGSALDSDLFINLPKMKTHQKAGVTGALKNLVGINGQKANLVHYRHGMARQSGDEFPNDISLLVWLQSRIRQRLQKRSKVLFRLLQPGWSALKAIGGVQTKGTRENLRKNFYLSGGAWYGNDTVWRMIYDLNRIIRYAPAEGGKLKTTPQRAYVAIMDGMIAGEGNGPLQPLPVNPGVLLAGRDPFAIDIVMARLMGFDHNSIPQLKHHLRFGDADWGSSKADELPIEDMGRLLMGIKNLPVTGQFLAPPGWVGHIEMREEKHADKRVQSADLF